MRFRSAADSCDGDGAALGSRSPMSPRLSVPSINAAIGAPASGNVSVSAAASRRSLRGEPPRSMTIATASR